MKNLSEPAVYFRNKFVEYLKVLKNKNDAIEFAFYDLKNKYKSDLDFNILFELPELKTFLYANQIGEESYFHFGKKNSKLSQAVAGLAQNYI